MFIRSCLLVTTGNHHVKVAVVSGSAALAEWLMFNNSTVQAVDAPRPDDTIGSVFLAAAAGLPT